MKGRDEVGRGIDEELRFHLEERIEALERAGLTSEQARVRALTEFGDVEAVRDGLERIDRRMARRRGRRERIVAIWQEWRQALRRLGRNPGFVAAVVLTLGLGIGAATAVFSLLDGVVLRALPYPSSERLVTLRNEVPGVGRAAWGWAQGQFVYVRSRVRSIEAMALYRISSSTVMEPGAESAAYGTRALASASLQEVLGAGVQVGRPMRPDENLADAVPVVLLTDSYWRRRLGADPSIVGRSIDLDGQAHEVIGVLAADARLPEEVEFGDAFKVDLWTPLRLDPADPPRNNHVYRAVGRLAPGAEPSAAAAELTGIYSRFTADLPAAYTERFMSESGFGPLVEPLQESLVGTSGRVLWILFGAVGLVLAITCANVANLFLVRLESRRREIAIRSVLGASRYGIIRQFLLESTTVTLLAGAFGMGVAAGAVALIRRTSPLGLPRVPELSAGASSAGFALVLALAIGFVFGILPGLRRPSGGSVLAETGRGATATRARLRIRHGLIATQVALCFVLLAGAGLLVRSFDALSRVDPGFDPDGVLVFRVVLPAERYPDYESTGAFLRDAADRLSAGPGVTSVGLVMSLPLGGDDGCTSVAVDVPGSDGGCVRVTMASPGYFDAAAIPVRGRDATWAEISAGERVAVISQALARRMFGEDDPLGRRVRAAATESWHTIVGVAGDVREGSLDDPASELLYLPVMPAQDGLSPARSIAFLVRTTLADPLTLLPSVRSTLASIDPGVPITRPQAMADLVDRSMARLTFMSTLLLVAAGMALLVGIVGIYGVVSYAVAQRRGEIGIRMALGARAAQVRSRIIGGSLGVAAAGIALGLLLVLPLAGTLRAYLYGVSAADPPTLLAVAAILLGLAAAASHLPARRAIRVEPVEALRPD